MSKSIRATLPMFLLFAVAFVVRVWGLDLKPPHFDEGINGHFVIQMWRDGYYRYDPTNFHGPLYFYILQLAELLFGRGIFGFRFVNGLISLGIVGLIAMHRRFFGQAALWAAWIVALSPAFVFYSRYAIHESLFVALQLAFAYGFFLWREEHSRTAIAWMAAGVFLSIAVKETFFIFFGTWAIAWFMVEVMERVFPAREATGVFGAQAVGAHISRAVPPTPWEIATILGLGVFSVLLLFSGFGMNPHGVIDMISAFAFWTKTGTGATGHEKAFWYYLNLLRLYEWPLLVALVFSPLVVFMLGRGERLMALTGIGLCLAYSLIPYKTPWLVLNFLWPLAFVLGFAVTRVGELAALRMHGHLRLVLGPVAVGTILVSAFTMLRLNFRDYTAESEPYVYVQTTMQFKHVMDTIEARRQAYPEDLNMKIAVLNRDPWPMPWTLSAYPHLVFNKANGPELFGIDLTDVDVVLCDASSRAAVLERLKGSYWEMPFKIRDAYEDGSAFLAFERFKGFVPSGTPVTGVTP